ncbi:hypothetical protein [Streptomyces sp. NPDC005799]|uniref:hypothetical protein n=1 Tax=Streptomyces sp. NPDC005799 TaxID=3154678 RepID=UPI0033C30C6E
MTDPRGERLADPQPPALTDQFGRGLLIVGTLADRWGTQKLTVGKTVRAELDLKKGFVT